jgi:hypothetical protein
MSVVPLIPLRRVDDLVERIETLMKDAERRGYGTLAYFLNTALIEARIERDRESNARDLRTVDPRDTWRPET